jgi:hypothetical protein
MYACVCVCVCVCVCARARAYVCVCVRHIRQASKEPHEDMSFRCNVSSISGQRAQRALHCKPYAPMHMDQNLVDMTATYQILVHGVPDG